MIFDSHDPKTTRVGLLIQGQFICDHCALQYDLSKNPKAIAVWLENILPYSQTCWQCLELVVKGETELECFN